jgi:glycosyltransferase involved in cell wall biosynthesis
MKIGYITLYFLPEIGGGCLRPYFFSKYLEQHDFHIITKKLWRSEFMMYIGITDFPLPKNMKVHRVAGMSLDPNQIGYLPPLLLKTLSLRNEIDLIHASSPPSVDLMAGYLASKISKKPLLLEFRDPWVRSVESRVNSFYWQYSPSGRFLKKVEEKLCKHARQIVVTNPKIKDELLRLHQLPDNKIHVVYNGADLEEFENVEPEKFDKFTVTYFGVIHLSRALDKMIEALPYLNDVQFILLGNGPHVNKLKSLARELGVKGMVKFLGTVPEKNMIRILLASDVFFISLDDRPDLHYLLPSKIFQAMAAGKPIIAIGPRNGDLENIINKHGCGIMLHTSNPEEIADSVRKTSDEMGRNGRKAVEKLYNVREEAKQIEKVYELCLSEA